MAFIHQLIDGTELKPGTPYYVKFRYRDIHGNLTLPSAATTVIMRYTDQNPGARVIRAFSSIVPESEFAAQTWTSYPFPSTATSHPEYFDVFGNYHFAGDGVDNPLVGLSSPASSCYFQMPCDGVCRVQARLGVYNNGDGKPEAYVRFGIFRLSSHSPAMPGSSSTVPVLPFYMGAHENHDPTDAATTYYATTAGTSLYVNLSGTVSAYSGDFITVAVFTEDDGICPVDPVGGAHPGRCYAHFSVTQD